MSNCPFFSLCIISARMVKSHDEGSPHVFNDFKPIVWFQVLTFALGGLLVASVIKFTDSVRKGLATGISVVTSSALSVIIEPDACNISLGFINGAAMAILGCFFFANPVAINCALRQNCIIPILVMGVSLLTLFSPVTMMNTQPFRSETMVKMTLAKEKISDAPPFWQNYLHVHVRTHGSNTLCGGCRVLHELADSIAELNVSTSKADACPRDDVELAVPLSMNQTIAIVYPEVNAERCQGGGNRVHVRWILAPLGKIARINMYKSWSENDLVFNFGSSCAVHPALLPRTNILQVITNPKSGDEFDLPMKALESAERQGTAWTMRKGTKWHPEIDHIHLKLPGPHVEVQHLGAVDFLKFEFFVSYDPYTFYSFAAAMSGAVSVVYPLSQVSKQDWAEGTYVGEYMKETGKELPGIAYGINKTELAYANHTQSELRDFMLKVRHWGRTVTVPRFLEDCYRYGLGETEFQSALLVRDAYTKWYDGRGQLNLTLFSTELSKRKISNEVMS